MASEGASANPIILGPSTPTCSPKPPSLPTLSPKLSPSADSFGSSRPVSQHSSSTSISDPSSEVEWSQIHRSVPADETTELPPPFVNRSPQSPKSPSPNLDSRPRSEPSTDTQGSDPGSQAPLPARGRWHSGEAWYKWYQVAGVAITLAVTVVALRYGVRSDRMARREMYNGDLQACLAYVQVSSCHASY